MKGAGDMGVYPWKSGAEAAPEWENMLGMRLSRVLATMVVHTSWLWSGGLMMIMAHQNDEGGN